VTAVGQRFTHSRGCRIQDGGGMVSTLQRVRVPDSPACGAELQTGAEIKSLGLPIKMTGTFIASLSLVLLCSCATQNAIHVNLPADAAINKAQDTGMCS